MENKEEKIKSELIGRAEEERNNLLKEIERLITSVLPGVKQDFENTFDTFIDMARQMNIPFNVDRNMENVIEQYISNLLVLKAELENLKITEEGLLKGTVIDKAQQIIPLIEPSILKARININNSNKNNLLESLKQKENVESKIANLKIKRMYLQGKLDSTWKRNEKIEFGQKIGEIDTELKLLENQLTEIKFKEDTINSNNSKQGKEELDDEEAR